MSLRRFAASLVPPINRRNLRYDAERWLATAIYDSEGSFVGTFDPRLDSIRDVNFTGRVIELNDYTANPDHKSIPVRTVPEFYWQCLKFHEDRHLGSWLNPFGIDLAGVLKIPYSTISRSIRLRRVAFGVGGSTLPMQFARVIYKTPPSTNENAWEKIGRKLSEWWTAPVIYFELTRGGDEERLKRWAANHLWLAQRTGGAPLHGVEVTSRIVFGKEAKDLSTAQQLVLASAVNKPIILLKGSKRLNSVRMDRWQYILEVRARRCAETLISNQDEQRKVLFELVQMAGGPPDPKVKRGLQAALEKHVPKFADRAGANPQIRANVLMPSARYGIREEMKQAFGFNWRNSVRGISTTIDPADNLDLRRRMSAKLRKLHRRWKDRLLPGFTLDPDQNLDEFSTTPNVIVVASDANGRIVRYYESTQLAPYFGSVGARDNQTGYYLASGESRQIASVGKMIAAVAIANQVTDQTTTLYVDDRAPNVVWRRADGTVRCAAGGRRSCRLPVPSTVRSNGARPELPPGKSPASSTGSDSICRRRRGRPTRHHHRQRPCAA